MPVYDFQVEKGRVGIMDIAQILRSQGFKVTPQRIAIYDALRGHHDHPTAEMIVS